MLILHPVLAAWARDEVCDVNYLQETIPQRKAGVLMDWADTMCEEGILQALEQDGVVTYLPTREILYKVFEGMSFLFDFFEHLFEEVPAAQRWHVFRVQLLPKRERNQHAPLYALG